MLFNLSDHNSIATEFLYELREKNVQQDRWRFRNNLERLGEILAYEISRVLPYRDQEILTPLETCVVRRLTEQPVLLTILRAGLPFTQGFLNFFDRADTGFIGAVREESDQFVEIKMNYVASPQLKERDIIVIDPMLATGSSVVKVLQEVVLPSKPRSIQLAAVIAAPEGVKNIMDLLKTTSVPVNVWVGSVDRKLDERFYIVPGLGDAGDLSFGLK